MIAENSRTEEVLRQTFKYGNRFMVLLFAWDWATGATGPRPAR